MASERCASQTSMGPGIAPCCVRHVRNAASRAAWLPYVADEAARGERAEVVAHSTEWHTLVGWLVAAGATGLLPASLGTSGFVLWFVSLLPLLVWLLLVGRRFSDSRPAQLQHMSRRINDPACYSPWSRLGNSSST